MPHVTQSDAGWLVICSRVLQTDEAAFRATSVCAGHYYMLRTQKFVGLSSSYSLQEMLNFQVANTPSGLSLAAQ
jgi:hypothetical protein